MKVTLVNIFTSAFTAGLIFIFVMIIRHPEDIDKIMHQAITGLIFFTVISILISFVTKQFTEAILRDKTETATDTIKEKPVV